MMRKSSQQILVLPGVCLLFCVAQWAPQNLYAQDNTRQIVNLAPSLSPNTDHDSAEFNSRYIVEVIRDDLRGLRRNIKKCWERNENGIFNDTAVDPNAIRRDLKDISFKPLDSEEPVTGPNPSKAYFSDPWTTWMGAQQEDGAFTLFMMTHEDREAHFYSGNQDRGIHPGDVLTAKSPRCQSDNDLCPEDVRKNQIPRSHDMRVIMLTFLHENNNPERDYVVRSMLKQGYKESGLSAEQKEAIQKLVENIECAEALPST